MSTKGIRQPGADRRSSHARLASLAVPKRACGIVHQWMQRANHAQIVGTTGQMRQQLAELHTALAMFGELEWAGGADVAVLLIKESLNTAGHGLAGVLLDRRLGIEQID